MRDPEAILFQRVRSAPLGAFRAVLAAVMLLESSRLLWYDRARNWFVPAGAGGAGDGVAPQVFHYRFPGLAWVPVPTRPWQFELHFACMGVVSAVMLLSAASSLRRRHAPILLLSNRHVLLASTTILLLLYSWFFLWDSSYYNNHYYLTILLLLGCVTTAADRGATSATVPRWHLLFFRFQISIVYFFGGIAKLNRDWLRGYPVRVWNNEAFERAFADVFDGALPSPSAYVIPEFLTYTICYGGLVLDLCAPLLLNAQHTSARRAGVGATLLFHFLNYHLFDIGVFPFLGAGASVLFLTERELATAWACTGVFIYSCINSLCCCCGRCCCRSSSAENTRVVLAEEDEQDEEDAALSRINATVTTWSRRVLANLLYLYAFIQIILPVRHFAYHFGTNQTVNWTGEGELFGWRMMLTSKRCTGHFAVMLRDGETLRVEVGELGFTQKQEWRVFQDPTRYTWQVAHFIRDQMGEGDVTAVYADASCSLNGGPMQPYINKTVDLLTVTDNLFEKRRQLWLPQQLSI